MDVNPTNHRNRNISEKYRWQKRNPSKSGNSSNSGTEQPSKSKLVAWISFFVLTLLFGLLALIVTVGDTSSFDRNLELAVHTLNNPVFTLIFHFFTAIGGFVGTPIMAVLVGLLLIWRKYHQYIIPLALAVGGGILLDELLKQIFRRTRPDLWTGIPKLTTFSFPSGHATASTCFFGFMLWLGLKFIDAKAWKYLWAGLMVIATVMVGISRIYLGEHYPTDVLGGFLAGSWWLVVLYLAIGFFRQRHKQPQPPQL